MKTPRGLIALLVMLAVTCAADAQVQDDSTTSRRHRVRLHGGVIPSSYKVIPVLTFNYHHRFSELGSSPAAAATGEIGVHWLLPYADAGIALGTDDMHVRFGVGAVGVWLLVPTVVVPYGVGAVTVAPDLGIDGDFEVEGRLFVTSDGTTLAMITIGFAMH